MEYSQVPNKRRGGWKWFNVTIIGGLEQLGGGDGGLEN